MIKPVKIKIFSHPIFGDKEKVFYTVFSLEDKAKEYDEFRKRREESEKSLKQGEHSEAREQHEEMVQREFNNIAGDYLKKIGFTNPKTRVSYGPEQQISINDSIAYILLDDPDEKKKISLLGEVNFKAGEELLGKAYFNRANQRGEYDYYDILKELFNSYKSKQRIAEPLVTTGNIMSVHPPDYLIKIMDLMAYFFSKADKKKLDFMLQLDYQIRVSPFTNDFTKEILKKEYKRKFKSLEKELSAIMDDVNLFAYFRKA